MIWCFRHDLGDVGSEELVAALGIMEILQVELVLDNRLWRPNG
jgi:hypothetical protein